MRLTLRADAGTTIGAGHVLRCTAIAQAAMTDGNQVLLVTEELPDELARTVEAHGVAWRPRGASRASLEDARQTLEIDGQPADWIVLDGYDFGPTYQDEIHSTGAHLLMLDDYAHQPDYHCTALSNPGGESLASRYQRAAPDSDLLLGPRYAPVRAEFVAPAASATLTDARPRLLVTLGASDPSNLTATVLEAIDRLTEPLTVRVLVGPLNPHLSDLRGRAARSRHAIEVIDSPERIWEQMTWADLALSAGGSTCWELACVGVPSLVVATTENQRWVSQTVSAAGAAVSLGARPDVRASLVASRLLALVRDAPKRSEMAARGRELVDGRGAERVLEYCLESLGE